MTASSSARRRATHLRLAALDLGALVAQPLEARLETGDLVAGEVEADGAQLVDQTVRGGCAASAWRCSGASWRRTSRRRSLRRSRLPSVALEPALGALLALAELQDAGGLLDDRPPLLGRRVQDRVELALADDHVLLAADARCRRAAPGCRAAGTATPLSWYSDSPGAEQRAGDRDLGELDREQTRRCCRS